MSQLESLTNLPIHPRTGLRAVGRRRDGRLIWPIRGGDGTGNPVLDRLRAQVAEQEAFISQLLEQVEAAGRDLVDAERANLDAARQRVAELDEQIRPLQEWEDQRAAHRAAVPTPPPPAPRDNPPGMPLGGSGQPGAARGLGACGYRTAGEFVVDYIRARHGGWNRDGNRLEPDRNAAQRVAAALGRAVANQTTAETPGILPEPIVGQIESDLDASRPFVTSLGAKPLGGIPGKTFTRPTITQHVEVDEQAAEKGELASQPMKIDGLPFTKKTYGGVVDVSRQDIDWTDPSAWNALLQDLQDVYGLRTELASSAAFAAGITQSVEVDGTDLAAWATALYQAAALAYQGGGRMPDRIWVSLDQWAAMGAVVDQARLVFGNATGTDSGLSSFAGQVLQLPRIVVPSFPDGTAVVGNSTRFEFYEERIGILQAVEPRLLGVEVAYGGYAAFDFLNKKAFCKLTAAAAP